MQATQEGTRSIGFLSVRFVIHSRTSLADTKTLQCLNFQSGFRGCNSRLVRMNGGDITIWSPKGRINTLKVKSQVHF